MTPCARAVRQGDWEVPSSREALDADSPWNQVLRGQLPGLFLRCGGERPQGVACAVEGAPRDYTCRCSAFAQC